MHDPRYVRETLGHIETTLQRFLPGIDASIQGVERAAAQTEQELIRRRQELEHSLFQSHQVRQRTESELAQAEEAVYICENSGYVDRDGRYHAPDSSRQRAAVHTCHRELEMLQRQIRDTEEKLSAIKVLQQALAQATAQFRARTSQTQAITSDTVAAANYWLRERQAALSEFDHSGDLTQAVGLLAAAAVSIFTNSVTGARINRLTGDLGEKQGVAAVKALGASRAGLGLHTGRQGLDVYGLRNTSKGRVLMRMEAKSTNNPKARGSVNEVLRLLNTGKSDGFQQASRRYGASRIENAARQGNRIARHIVSSQSATGPGRILRSEDYVHWVNFATGEEKTFRAVSNDIGDRVSRLSLVRHIPMR